MHAPKVPTRSGGTTPEYSHHSANGTCVYGLPDTRDFQGRLCEHFGGDWPLYNILAGVPHQEHNSQDHCPSLVRSLHCALRVPGSFTQWSGQEVWEQGNKGTVSPGWKEQHHHLPPDGGLCDKDTKKYCISMGILFLFSWTNLINAVPVGCSCTGEYTVYPW